MTTDTFLPPLAKPRCIDCKFFSVAFAGAPEKVLGECRRYPPPHRSRHSGEAANYPFVNEDDWCGEYKGETADSRETSRWNGIANDQR